MPEVLDEERFWVLNSIVLKKMATLAAVGHAADLPLNKVEAVVDDLEASGDVARVDDQLFPMESAQTKVKEYADLHYADLRADPALVRWMERFEVNNERFLRSLTDWQRMDIGGKSVPNDHGDSGYDARVISKLEAAVQAVNKLIEEVAPRAPLLGRYKVRFHSALEKVEEGDIRYVSDPLLDSVHNVWFELHEAILWILGRDRTG